MSEYRIKLQDRYTSIFGIVAKNVIPALTDIGVSNGTAYGIFKKGIQVMDPANTQSQDSAQPYSTVEAFGSEPGDAGFNDLGNPMWDLLELENPDLPGGRFQFRFPVQIMPSREPNISTTIVNQNAEAGIDPGEIVESFGWKPWRIRVRGLLVDMENHQFPLDLMGELNRSLSLNATYNINNKLLNELEIYEVYLSGAVEFTPSREYKDTVEFNLILSSHETIEALILNSNS